MYVDVERSLNYRKTVELCRKLEAAGVSFLTVHGRTIKQKSTEAEPVDLEAIRTIRESVQLPVVANGDVFSLEDAHRTTEVFHRYSYFHEISSNPQSP